MRRRFGTAILPMLAPALFTAVERSITPGPWPNAARGAENANQRFG